MNSGSTPWHRHRLAVHLRWRVSTLPLEATTKSDAVASRTIVALVALWLALTPAWSGAREQAATPMATETPSQTCASSGPTSRRYGGNVCIMAPGGGAQLTGNQTVLSSVTVTGRNAGIQTGSSYSSLSSPAVVRTPAFSDGFESGDLSRWETKPGLVVQQGAVGNGTWVARATSTGAPTYARQALSVPQSELFYRIRFQIISQNPAQTVSLLKLRTAADAALLTFSVTGAGQLGVRNDVAGLSRTSTQTVTPGVWHEAQVHLHIDAANPSAGQVEVWYDKSLIPDLSGTQNLGIVPVGRLQLGEHAPGLAYDLVFDDIVADTQFIGTPPAVTPNPTTAATSIPTTTPTPTPTATPRAELLSDGFESGTMAQWTSVMGALAPQQGDVASGTWAAHATSPSASGAPTAAYASKTLNAAQTDLYYRIKFKLLSTPTASTYLGKFRTEANASILGVYVSESGKLSYRNDVGRASRTSPVTVTTGEWHEVQVRLRVDTTDPAAGQVEVWYDGVPVPELSRAENLGTTPVGRLQLGENATGRPFDLVFDDVLADTRFIESQLASGTTTSESLARTALVETTEPTSSEPASTVSDLVAKAEESPVVEESPPPDRRTAQSSTSLETSGGTARPSPMCKESGPPDRGYTLNLCITTPGDGAELGGNQTVESSITVTGNDPGVQSLTFFLDGEHLISDFEPSYSFFLPTERWGDGTHILAVAATMRDDFESERTTAEVTFSNGVTTPPVNDNTFTPSSGTVPPPGQPFVLAATGDGAGGETSAARVVDMIDSWSPNMFLYLGDVYESGSSTEFLNWYASEYFFGRFRDITNPTVGNHEYLVADAEGYFDYWDNVPPYYSFDAGGWHVISLNSNGPKNAQYQWLRQDLQAHPNPCTIAYFHHPLFSIGPLGGSDQEAMKDLWILLDEQGVDIVLTGHEHSYQRWKPLNGAGEFDPDGITQFVIGTGGHGIQSFAGTDSRVAASDATKGDFGALRLELDSGEASFQYITTAGQKDSGTILCDDAVVSTPMATPTESAWRLPETVTRRGGWRVGG